MISARGDYANQCNMAYIKNPNNITRHQSQLFNDRFDFFFTEYEVVHFCVVKISSILKPTGFDRLYLKSFFFLLLSGYDCPKDKIYEIR